MKQILKKGIIFAMTGIMLLGSVAPTFANVEEKQTVSANNNAQAEVIYNQESTFGVKVPKLISLDSDKTSSYTVEVFGDISSDETICAIPDNSFLMKDTNTSNPKDDVEALVNQTKTEWKFNEFKTIGNGKVTAENLTAGIWEGKFYFNIKLKNCNISVTATNEAGENLNASATYITGSEKDNLLNSLVEEGFVSSKDDVDALINVDSDNFDGIADTTFDVSDIAKEGEKVVILHFDEEKQQWEYIGTETVDENGLIKGDFTSYSPVAFVKVTENGNYEQINKLVATFADNSWENIAKACQTNSVPDTWNIGDIKTMLVDGVEYEVAIIGKNHDTYADGSGTAPLTFQLVDTLNTQYRINSTNTNAGGWSGSNLYKTLNTTIFDSLEDSVKNNIKSISKITSIGNTDAGGKTPTTTKQHLTNYFSCQ